MTKLFNYRRPGHASRTVKRLRAAYPHFAFNVVLSPLASYAFRYLIQVTIPDRPNKAFVEKKGF